MPSHPGRWVTSAAVESAIRISSPPRGFLDDVATCGYSLAMQTVGVRELKNRLSAFLRQVRSGGSVLVTDRGEVVAEISPPGQRLLDTNLPPGLVALARKGWVTLGSRSKADLYEELPRKEQPPQQQRRHSAAQLLDEERGSR